MMVLWSEQASDENISSLETFARSVGFECLRSQIGPHQVTLLQGEGFAMQAQLQAFPGVEKVVQIRDNSPPPLVRARARRAVNVGNIKFGDGAFVFIGGPCSVENEEQMLQTATALKDMGVQVIRGGAFKPRTSPYSFQGLGHEALDILSRVSRETGMPMITEILSPRDLELAESKVDMIWVGARNMQNYALLKELAQLQIPVILKRGMSATIHEFLMAAEYLLSEGNENVILCERGVRGFEPLLRYQLDLGSIAMIREMTQLPLIVDPSHSCGNARLVRSVSRGVAALGVDGLMVEAHPDPRNSVSDADQALSFEEFRLLVQEVRSVSEVVQSFEFPLPS